MEPSALTTATIWATFRGTRCAVCGGRKYKHNAFCSVCYQRLPRILKKSLWKRFGEGFEEAYRVCVAWFPEHRVEQEWRKRAWVAGIERKF